MHIILALLLTLLTACTQSNNQPNSEVSKQTLETSGDGNFGVVQYSEVKVKSFVFTNNTDSTVSLNPQIIGTHSSAFQQVLNLGCSNLEVNKKCLVKVMFNSNNKESGTYQAQLQVSDSLINLSAQIESVPNVVYSLTINGEETYQLDPLQGKEIKLLTVKVKNISPKLGSVSTLQSSNNRFSILQSTCINLILKPGQSCTAKIVLKGNNTAETLISDLTFDNKTASISSVAEVQNLPSNLTAIVPEITLGDFYQEGSLKLQAITIVNQGSGVGSIDSVTLPPGYSIATNNCLSVKPLASCVIRIVYNSSNLSKGQHTDSIDLGDSEVDLVINQVSKPNDLQSLNLNVIENIPVGNCQAVSIVLKDSQNLDFVSSQSTAVNSSLTTYSDSSCLTTQSVVIPAFESSKTFFIKSNSAGNQSLSLTALNKTESKDLYFYSPLNLISNQENIVIGQSTQITIQGGKPPHELTIQSGGGTLNSSGEFLSSAVGVTTFKVVDSMGQERTTAVNVVSVLNTNVLSFEKITNQSQQIEAIGGLPPYSYSIASGSGTINSSGIFSSSTAGNNQISVKDALNQEVIVSGVVYSVLSLSPLNSSIILSQNQNFVATGGKTPYVFSKVSGVGEISPSGLFSSLNVGSAQIKVIDSLGQEITTAITVNSNIVLSAGTCSFSIPEQVDCTVSATGGIGSKTFSSSSGVINPTTGVFYGVCSNNTGSSVVTVTDSQGNNQSITLTYPCVYKTCNQIKADVAGVISGSFWVDNDAHRTGTAPYQVYCNMEQNGGGWTLVAKYGNTSNNTYHWFTPSSGTLSLNENFVNEIQIASYANAQASQAQRLMVTFNGDKTNNYVVDNLTVNKNRLWSGNPINESLGTLSVTHSSLVGSAYSVGQTVRMHFGTYSTNLGSGLTSGVSANQSLGVIADCANYCNYRLPGIGAIPTGNGSTNWPLERNPLQVFIQTPYKKYATSCSDAQSSGYLNLSGVAGTGNFIIDPDGANYGQNHYQVYCDFSNPSNSTASGTGGVVTYDGDYKIHTFNSNDSFTLVTGSTVELLVVGGGGGGGSSKHSLGGGGGGGAGGLIYNPTQALSRQAYPITIGTGGGPGSTANGTNGGNGNPTTFSTLYTAVGGGGGGNGSTCGAGQNGASGGGAGYCGYGANNGYGSPTAGSQGTRGGNVVATNSGLPSASAAGAGGGGATAIGGINLAGHVGGIGGAGRTLTISGVSKEYARGGDGGGGKTVFSGPANTGNGGYGSYAVEAAGAGGSGVVIVRYKYKN